MNKLLLLATLFVVLFSSNCSAAWNNSIVGVGTSWMESLAVGNGRNDGVTRVYGGNRDTHIYEFTYSRARGVKQTWAMAKAQ